MSRTRRPPFLLTITACDPNANSNESGSDGDSDGDSLSVTLGSDVSDGILMLSGDGSFTYTPNVGFSGVDSFTYTADDGTLTSSEVTATITVGGLNEAPIANLADAPALAGLSW